jgi:hypothetical protein
VELVSEDMWDKDKFWDRESIVEVLESVVLLRLGAVEFVGVDFFKMEEGGLEPETWVDVEDVVDCLCATGGGGVELSEVVCGALSFSLSLWPRCGK